MSRCLTIVKSIVNLAAKVGIEFGHYKFSFENN